MLPGVANPPVSSVGVSFGIVSISFPRRRVAPQIIPHGRHFGAIFSTFFSGNRKEICALSSVSQARIMWAELI